MPTKLTERSQVKDLASIARADTQWDSLLDGMIDQVSMEVENLTDRLFLKTERTEYHRSYEQGSYDPVPQYLWVRAWPIDEAETLTIIWDAYDKHSTSGTTLLLASDDYKINGTEGLITVRQASGLINALPPVSLGKPFFTYNPRGFQVLYTGGYAVNVKPIGEAVDPMDDYGVIQVPASLMTLIARKIADDWKKNQALLSWTSEQKKALKSWRRKDTL